jgi:hypothetical protein
MLVLCAGDGEPTDNAADFYSWIGTEVEDVENGAKDPYLEVWRASAWVAGAAAICPPAAVSQCAQACAALPVLDSASSRLTWQRASGTALPPLFRHLQCFRGVHHSAHESQHQQQHRCCVPACKPSCCQPQTCPARGCHGARCSSIAVMVSMSCADLRPLSCAPTLCRPAHLPQGVHYGVFGLGNKQYEHFNAVGKRMHKNMEALGATAVCPRGDGDDDDNIGKAQAGCEFVCGILQLRQSAGSAVLHTTGCSCAGGTQRTMAQPGPAKQRAQGRCCRSWL